jgi:chemotaxis protein CheX
MKSPHKMMTDKESRESWLPLLELAVQEVFQIMLSSQLESAEGMELTFPEFTSMVGLAGQLCGLLSVCCSAKSAALITSKMLGVDPKDAKEQLWDAMGEVCNMVAGNFKNKLSGLGESCMLSVPTVITGADYSTHSLADSGALQVTLSFEGEPISVSLEIHS